MCPAPKGNQFWKARSKHGRDKIFETPEILWEASEEYFQWVEDNPLMELRGTQFQGAYVTKEFPKMRAMTITGLCIFLDIDQSTWEDYRERKDFIRITKKVEAIIYAQKFSGAAADMLNPNIIARDLGLADKKEVKSNISVTALLSEIKQSTDLPDVDIDE